MGIHAHDNQSLALKNTLFANEAIAIGSNGKSKKSFDQSNNENLPCLERLKDRIN